MSLSKSAIRGIQAFHKIQASPKRIMYLISVRRIQTTQKWNMRKYVRAAKRDKPQIVEKEIIECSINCGGCACHIHPPCGHCEEGHGQEKEV